MIAIALWDLYRVNEANFRENHARKFNKSRWHFTRNFIRSHVGLHSRSTGNIYSKVSKHSQKSNNSVFHYWVADKGKGIPSWFFPFSRAKCARELASKHADTDALALKFYSINVDKKKKKREISYCEYEILIFHFCPIYNSFNFHSFDRDNVWNLFSKMLLDKCNDKTFVLSMKILF